MEVIKPKVNRNDSNSPGYAGGAHVHVNLEIVVTLNWNSCKYVSKWPRTDYHAGKRALHGAQNTILKNDTAARRVRVP